MKCRCIGSVLAFVNVYVFFFFSKKLKDKFRGGKAKLCFKSSLLPFLLADQSLTSDKRSLNVV